MSNTPARIIHATPDHADLIAPLFDAYRQFYQQPSDVDAARKFLAHRLSRQQSEIFLALREETGVGFTQLYPAFSSVAMKPLWILNDLFVVDPERRRGTAQRLLAAAAEFAADQGACRLVLATAKDNDAAQSLYEQSGWTKDNTFDQFEYAL